MIAWIKSLLGQKSVPSDSNPRGPQPSDPLTESAEGNPALPTFDNLDHPGNQEADPEGREAEILTAVARRVAAGKFELPSLPAANIRAMNMSADPNADVEKIVELISSDPALSGELLRTANSALFATGSPAETLHEAVMRIGLRGLRSLIYTTSVRGVIMRQKGLAKVREEVWRQTNSVGTIARSIARCVEVDPEKAFLMGLLHDIGKVVLLAMLNQESKNPCEVTPATLGRAFYEFRETAGAALAKKWNLAEDLLSVAGGHHRFAENKEHKTNAALVSLAHQMDLYLSTGNEVEYRALVRSPQMDHLGLMEDERREILDLGSRAFRTGVQQAVAA